MYSKDKIKSNFLSYKHKLYHGLHQHVCLQRIVFKSGNEAKYAGVWIEQEWGS